MAISLVQSKAGSATSGGSLTFSLGSSTTAGNCLVVAIFCIGSTSNPSAVGSVTLGGSAGNFASAVIEGASSSSVPLTAIWADPDCAGGQTSIVVTMTGGSGTVGVIAFAYELAGIATASPVDKTAGTTKSSASTSFTTTATATTAQAAEAWIGIGGTVAGSGSPALTGPASPWANLADTQVTIGGLPCAAISGSQITSSTGTATYSGTISPSEVDSACVVTLLPGSGGNQSVSLPVAAAALAAPVPSPTAGATVALPVAAATLAAPAVTPALAVQLPAAAITLAAPAVTPKAGATVALPATAVTLAAPAVSTPAAVAPLFPAAPLGAQAELLLSGTWTDVTQWVNYSQQLLTITRGHPDESTTTNPSTCSFSWDNSDGRFSSKNPLGPYYGSIGRNTRIRVSVPASGTYLRSETDQQSYASAPDTAGLSITGDTEIQLDVTLDNWRRGQILACKWVTTGNQQSWILILREDGTLNWSWSHLGSDAIITVSTVPVPVPALRRQAIRVTLATGTGTVTYYTAPTITGSWAQLGAPVIMGAATVFDSTAPVQLGYGTQTGSGYTGYQGALSAFNLLSGIGGAVRASPDFTFGVTAGVTALTDGQGNTWTVQGTAEISDRDYRGHFELSAMPQTADPSGTEVLMPVQASGILRRIQQGTEPLASVLRRTFTQVRPPDSLVGYWPFEDGNAIGSGTPAVPSQFASAVPGGTAATWTGATPGFASDSSFLCSLPLPALNKSRIRCLLPARGPDTANVFRFLLSVPASGDTNGGLIARMFTEGTVGRADLVYNTGGALELIGFDQNDNQLWDTGAVSYAVNGTPIWCSIELQTSGSGVQYSVVTLEPGAAGAVGGTLGTTPSASIGNATYLVFGNNVLTGTAVGHATYQAAWESLYDFADELNAWQGEAAGQRFSRLCGEQGIPFRSAGNLDDTVLMGAQTALALTDLLQECEDADRGQVFEPRQAFALGYRTRASLQNQAPGVTFDYQGQLAWPLQETEDDQYTLNDVTVTRAYGPGGGQGSSAEAILETGPLSVQDPPDGVGYVQTSVTANVAADSQLADLAGWILSLGTADEPRYPAVYADLASTALASTLRYSVPALDVGDRLVVEGTPGWLPPDGITGLINGITEVIGEKSYGITFCAVPELPYETGIVGDPVYAQADTDGSALHASVTAAAVTIQVDTSAASPPRLWTTDSGNMPFDIKVAGERMTVTAISGTSSPQSLTVTRAVNGVSKAQAAGTDVCLFYPTIVSL